MKYIVEHLEEEIEGWPELEYRNMLANVGEGNLWLSHVSEKVAQAPPASLKGAVISTDSIQMWKGVDLSRVLLADPSSTEPLTPEDASHYDYILFGEQMTTDTAVLVSQIVLEKGVPLDKIEYVNRPEIKLGRREMVELPFKYIRLPNGEPKLPPGLIQHLKDGNDMSLN
ncbi:hypothetical protein BSLG_001653 [Batrachochytrium salamandrivorans]|nr:hypothetical protein BSLG_001653 [Batrachochytrium salamandrivorans]